MLLGALDEIIIVRLSVYYNHIILIDLYRLIQCHARLIPLLILSRWITWLVAFFFFAFNLNSPHSRCYIYKRDLNCIVFMSCRRDWLKKITFFAFLLQSLIFYSSDISFKKYSYFKIRIEKAHILLNINLKNIFT